MCVCVCVYTHALSLSSIELFNLHEIYIYTHTYTNEDSEPAKWLTTLEIEFVSQVNISVKVVYFALMSLRKA